MTSKFLLVSLAVLIVISTSFAQNLVHVITVDGVINPASAEYFKRAIDDAEDENAHCLIIQLDTPGGLVSSMREIAKDILASPTPVVIYVSPAGARAASAGTFIAMAAHIAAMAPGTNIGAASVVSLYGGKDSSQSVMMRKATNDAVAFIRSLAEKRGRNADWAEKAVTKAASVSSSQALELNVIDVVAESVDSLLLLIDGKVVDMIIGSQKLATKHSEIKYLDRPWRYKILDKISDPNIAYILFIVGIWGLFFELNSPGTVLPGVVGGICIIMALYAMNTLPVNYAGVLLILFGIVLFLLEIKIPSYGVLTIGGVIAFVFGSIMLYDSDLAIMQVSWKIITAVTVFTLLFFMFALGLGIRAQQRKPVTGQEKIVEGRGKAIDDFLNGEGQIYHNGEIWQAASAQKICKNDPVKIAKMEGLKLIVEKEKS